MTEVKVPALAESISEVTLSRWLVKDGDYVELDQPLCEFETDKASQELPSPVAGIIKLVANDGDDLKIGALICNIDETTARPAGAEKKEAAPKAEEKKAEPKKEEPKKEEPKKDEKSYATGTPSPAAKKNTG